MDISKYLNEKGYPRRLTPEERAEIDALPPAERAELKNALLEAQYRAMMDRDVQCVYGPPNAPGPAFVPQQQEVMLYGPPPVQNGFIGMASGGMMMADWQKLQGAQPAQQSSPGAWQCSCGSRNTGRFCPECGKPKPAAWVCKCGAENTGKFCQNCGAKKE